MEKKKPQSSNNINTESVKWSHRDAALNKGDGTNNTFIGLFIEKDFQ